MEEEEGKSSKSMDMKRPRNLNFNVPLLSIRRRGCPYGADTSCSKSPGMVQNTSERIPFSWEQAAGKPKELERDVDDGTTPRLGLPPSLWRPPQEEEALANNDHADNSQKTSYAQDDGCDGDVDDDDNNDNFSDAMDVFSLSEAIDIVQRSEKACEFNRLKSKIANCGGNESPNYIINRFLPDATAIAAASSLHASNNPIDKKKSCYNYNFSYPEDSVRQSYASAASPKGCGLDILFPWRMKYKLCSMKSPVRHCSTTVEKQQWSAQKHQTSTSKQKRS